MPGMWIIFSLIVVICYCFWFDQSSQLKDERITFIKSIKKSDSLDAINTKKQKIQFDSLLDLNCQLEDSIYLLKIKKISKPIFRPKLDTIQIKTDTLQ